MRLRCTLHFLCCGIKFISLNLLRCKCTRSIFLSRHLEWSGRKMVVDPPLALSFQDLQNEVSQGGEAYFTLFNCPLPLITWGKLLTSKLIKKSGTFDKHQYAPW